MRNNIKMDVYRLCKSKSFYITLAIFLTVLITVLWGVSETGSTGGTATFGANTVQITGFSMIQTIQLFTGSGLLIMIAGVFAVVFYDEEQHSGFDKNIYALQIKKWKVCVGRWLIGVIFISVFFLSIILGVLITSSIVGIPLENEGVLETILFIVEMIFMNTVYLSVATLLVNITKGKTIAIVIIFILTSGMIDNVIASILDYFNLFDWTKVSPFINMIMLPPSYDATLTIRALALNASLLAVCWGIHIAYLRKRDV